MNATQPSNRGLLLIVCGPSGVGKSSLCRRLLADFDNLGPSISVTTRAPRHTEEDGVDYHFVTRDAFDDMVGGGRFAEHATVHGNSYGTLKGAVEDVLDSGGDMIFDIDYQGAQQLKVAFPQATAVLLLPPSMQELEARLRARQTDAEDVILRRLAAARDEISHHALFDFAIVNDDLEIAYQNLRAVYTAQRLSTRFCADVLNALLTAP